jgi:hypothetical protein
MAGVALVAEAAPVGRHERQPRDDGDAVVAALAVDEDVPVAAALKRLRRKSVLRTLDLLEAEDVSW